MNRSAILHETGGASQEWTGGEYDARLEALIELYKESEGYK